MNERDYDVTYEGYELSIRRVSDQRTLTVCFQGPDHEIAAKSDLHALEYVRSFVDKAIDDQKSSAMPRRDLMHEQHSEDEIAEHKRLAEVLQENIQAAEDLTQLGEDADDDIRQEACAKKRKAREAIRKAAVRDACRTKGLGLEATEEVIKRCLARRCRCGRPLRACNSNNNRNPTKEGLNVSCEAMRFMHIG